MYAQLRTSSHVPSPGPEAHGLPVFEALGLVKGSQPKRSWQPQEVRPSRDGIFPKNAKCLSKHAPFESTLESIALVLLSADYRIRHFACQPHTMEYWATDDQGALNKRSYTPDFVAVTRDGRLIVIDVKAKRFATDQKWLEREPAVRAAYKRDYGADLIIWSEEALYAEPRLSNARTLYRHRFAEHGCNLGVFVTCILSELGGKSTVGELCDEFCIEHNQDASDAFGAIMRLALDGVITLDPSRKYDRDTSIEFREVSL